MSTPRKKDESKITPAELKKMAESAGYREEKYFKYSEAGINPSEGSSFMAPFVLPPEMVDALTPEEKLEYDTYSRVVGLNIEGIKLIAKNYKEQYGIDIIALHNVREPNKHVELYNQIKLCAEKKGDQRIGIIANPTSTGHFTPLIYEKKGDTHRLFMFDTLGLKSNQTVIDKLDSVAEPDYFKNWEFYLSTHLRQTDGSSCKNDAFLVLKEALLLKGDLVDAVRAKSKISDGAVTLKEPLSLYSCDIPLVCLKASQRSKALVLSETDAKEIIQEGMTIKDFYAKEKLKLTMEGTNFRTGEPMTATFDLSMSLHRLGKKFAEITLPMQYVVEYEKTLDDKLREKNIPGFISPIIKQYLGLLEHANENMLANISDEKHISKMTIPKLPSEKKEILPEARMDWEQVKDNLSTDHFLALETLVRKHIGLDEKGVSLENYWDKKLSPRTRTDLLLNAEAKILENIKSPRALLQYYARGEEKLNHLVRAFADVIIRLDNEWPAKSDEICKTVEDILKKHKSEDAYQVLLTEYARKDSPLWKALCMTKTTSIASIFTKTTTNKDSRDWREVDAAVNRARGFAPAK